MGLAAKILSGLVGLIAAVVLIALTVFWWAPVGLNNYANKIAVELALDSPELLTRLGLVDNTLIDFHSDRLDDHTEARDRQTLALLKKARAGLEGYGPEGLKGQDELTWPILAAMLDDQVRALESRIPPSPYRVNQISGIAIEGPAFLTDFHQVTGRRSAERYLKRVEDFGRVLREEKARVEADRDAGITPPDFIIDKAMGAMRGFIEGGAEENLLVTNLEPKLDRIEGLSAQTRDRFRADAVKAVGEQVIPGYQALIALFEEMKTGASHDAGVWRLPGGAEYYAGRLKSQTTTDLSADEIHEIGLSEVARIEMEMSAVLDRMGIPPGDFTQRIEAAMTDPAQLFPNDEEGREEMLDYLRMLKNGFDAKAKEWFLQLPTQKLEIVRVPAYAEESAAGGYYNPPSLDGKRPGRFFINLRNTADYPKWTLPTLFYHEAEPGHHFQLSAAQNVKGVPILRQVVSIPAFSEGWGLYAEKLASEMGFYDGDPAGDLGRLQSEMFRAARLVVDTGMHAKRWSREEAIGFMRARTGMTEEEVTREVERYAAWPGQACAYKIGELTILRLREEAKRGLGAKFDIRAFHDEVLMNGGMPLPVLEQVIDDWIAETKAAG